MSTILALGIATLLTSGQIVGRATCKTCGRHGTWDGRTWDRSAWHEWCDACCEEKL
jgi:hypothetical protein